MLGGRGSAAALMLGVVVLLVSGTAGADIYSYTDEQGVTHFTNLPTDKRYKLVLKTPRRSAAASSSAARAASFQSLVQEVARQHRLEPALLHAVIAAESAHNPRALSPKGAMGLMQLMPDTAQRYGASDPYDPAQNVKAGARYLRDLLDTFQNLELALAAYNAGEGAVVKHGNKIPPYRETLDYVPKVLDLYATYKARMM